MNTKTPYLSYLISSKSAHNDSDFSSFACVMHPDRFAALQRELVSSGPESLRPIPASAARPCAPPVWDDLPGSAEQYRGRFHGIDIFTDTKQVLMFLAR